MLALGRTYSMVSVIYQRRSALGRSAGYLYEFLHYGLGTLLSTPPMELHSAGPEKCNVDMEYFAPRKPRRESIYAMLIMVRIKSLMGIISLNHYI
jgi:hypothetical protein